MNRSTILEAMYEVIKESTEWGLGEKDYGQFVDGVVAMTEKILELSYEEYKHRIEGMQDSIDRHLNTELEDTLSASTSNKAVY